MKTFLIAGLAAAGLAGPVLADPVFGLWRTEPDAQGIVSLIQIVDCDDRICGQLVSLYSAEGRPLDSPHIGRRYIWDMEPRGSGQYRDGRQWIPERDQEYRAHMELAGDRLTVKACTMVVLCSERVWTRVN
ncbi:DUF2147 domain-containing protein [Pararhodobacter sp. SW119]|uniref:DUF2147 domain-containing protein n=1 Tax=Pararhodobacter sp. SW119 TaxID=2780075 RepID=UPI001ADF56F7|nr:DUF2147 domain-containing protein [Pararhodobacter sp. SW119]